ncbi:TonB-dependent siderophore receptor [Pasteurella sp. PK-2025]|uniref:TonB-dependent siderophore receptor n=1 Tax=unclassified Pasteurella TaxID=2621516 RepID=UPI003C7117D4
MANTPFRFSLLSLALFSSMSMADSLKTIEIQASADTLATGYSPTQSVSGMKTTTALMRTPLSVEIVSNKLMKDQGVDHVIDALNYHSGIISNYRGSNQQMEITIRGVGSKNNSSGGSVPTYVNGISYAADYAIRPFFLERIDIVKGPNSVLYGQANPGGVMDVITKKASGKNQGELQLITGTKNRYQIGLDIERQLTETLSARVIGQFEKNHWKEHYVKEQGGAVSPSLFWQPTDQTKFTLYAYFAKHPKAGDRNFLVRKGMIEPVEGKKIPYDFFPSDPNFHHLSTEQVHVGYQFSHQFSDRLTFRQNVRYSRSKENFKNLVGISAGKGTTLNRAARAWIDEKNEFGVDNQLENRFTLGNTKHQLLVGVDYRHKHDDTVMRSSPRGKNAPAIDWANPQYGLNIETPPLFRSTLESLAQLGIYAQNQIEIGNLDLLIGGRWDKVNMRNEDRLKAKSTSNADQQFTWRTGAIYNFNNGLAPYLSYSTSFMPTTRTDEKGNPLNATRAAQWEAGVKYQPNERLFLTLAGFEITQRDLVENDPKLKVYKQIGKVKIQGAEVNVSAQLSEQLALLATYAQIKKTIKASPDKHTIGKTPWGIPRHQASFWTKYQFNTGALNGLALAGGIRYFGSTWGNNTNTFKVPHFTLYDMAIQYDLARQFNINMDLQLNIQNLTNKQYVSSCANDNACFYGKERNISLTANYRF